MATLASGGSDRGRFRRKRSGQGRPTWRPEVDKEKQSKDNAVNVNINSAVLEAFRGYQIELDSRNDCYERIVKLSRDITIESKRIIFLLHRATGSEDRDTIVADADIKFKELRATKFIPLAKELDGKDPYQFLRAYSPGLQEYIEAVTFYHYLTNNELLGLEIIQAELTFLINNTNGGQLADTRQSRDTTTVVKKGAETSVENRDGSVSDKNLNVECGQDALPGNVGPQSSSEKLLSSVEIPDDTPKLVDCVGSSQTVSVPVPPTEYILGVADFTGELMKMAINSVGSGDLNTPTVVADMMRVMHDAFASFGNIRRDLRQKIRVLRQSLQKVETACYAMKVRGSEMPTHMLVDVFTTASAGANDAFNMDEQEELYD